MSERREPGIPRVGFVGLGSQGAPMARRIVESGYPLTLWARRPEATNAFADTAASVAGSPAEVGAASEVVGICVVSDADVDAVVLGAEGVLVGMTAGGIIAIHATVHPDTCRRVADAAADRQVQVVDAPVSGGGVAASERRLLVMVGGDDDAVARCRPIFDTFAGTVIHLGALGSGEVAKALNNFVMAALTAVALETFEFADGLGVDRAALAEVLAHASGGSTVVDILARSGFDVAGLARGAPLVRKDVNIALDLGTAAGAPAPTTLTRLADQALAALGAPR